MKDERHPAEARLAEELRLRPERPPVTRLSRKVLMGLAAIAALAVLAALIWALEQGRTRRMPVQEIFSTEHKATADGLASLPNDYSQIPQLGPPLPGDLGRPILRAQERGAPVPLPNPTPVPGISADEQRRLQEEDAARVSKLIAITGRPSASATPAGASRTSTRSESADDPLAVQNMQEQKLAFLNAAIDRRTTSPDRLQRAASAYVVQAGSVIPAALITGIRSDLPGQVTAQVTENVYDSPSGRFLLIPQGARLVGQYDSQVAFGQSRVLLVWTRLILPNGRSIVLERQPGADPQGFAGLEDEVDYHWGKLFRAAALSTLLAVGTELGAGNDENEILRALRRGSRDTVNNAGQQIVRRQLNVQPTLTIRPGFPVRVIVNRDLVLAPYQG